MSAPVAGLAGVLAVMAAWDGLGALSRLPLLAGLTSALLPAREAGESGRAVPAGEQRQLAVLIVLTVAACGWFLSGPLMALVLAACGPAAATRLFRLRRARWRRRAAAGAAPAALALADALAAGSAMPRAIAIAAADGAVGGAARSLLSEASTAIALGESTTQALNRVRRRAGAGPWDALAAAILMQRESGGDLAALLRDLAHSAQGAQSLEADARAASAQARLTAQIVLALPLLAVLLGEVVVPGTLASMLSGVLGRTLLLAAAVLQIGAFVLVTRIARVRE